MLFELFAVICAGAGGAGIALALWRISGRRLPRWITPAAAGLAMIAVTTWLDYDWYARTAARLPAGVEVSEITEARQFWRPWTYLAPLKTRFVAIDTASMKTNPELPGQHIADVYLLARWHPVERVPVALDCTAHRRAPMLAGAGFAADGEVTGVTWSAPDASDPLLKTACGA